MLSHYELHTHWTIPARIEDVFAVLNDTAGYARWWSKVFLHTEVWTEDGQRLGRILSRGWLPYRLRWTGRQSELIPPRTLAMAVTGDFTGEGRWELRQAGDVVEVDFRWRIDANKPLLRYCSWLLKPVFKANHDWAMRQGRAGLLVELARRQREQRATTG